MIWTDIAMLLVMIGAIMQLVSRPTRRRSKRTIVSFALLCGGAIVLALNR